MPYEDWWWDVVKQSSLGFQDEGGFGEEEDDKRQGSRFGNPIFPETPTNESTSSPRTVDPKRATENTSLARLGSDASDNLDRKETEAEKKKREREETAAENRAFVSERGYDKIKKPVDKKKETWWSKIKDKMPEKVRSAGRKLDEVTDDPGIHANRAIQRFKTNRAKKKKEKARKKGFERHLKTPEGQARLAQEKERRKQEKLAERASTQGNTPERQEIYDRVDEIVEQRPPPDPTIFSVEELNARLIEFSEAFKENKQTAIQDKPELIQTLQEMLQNPELDDKNKQTYDRWLKALEKQP